MYKVGITGGIGSGKSVVCTIFETLGIPLFNADKIAIELIEHHPTVKTQIIDLFGKDVYDIDGSYNRKKVSSIVFQDSEKLAQLNAIVHPAVLNYGEEWANAQSSPYIVKEAALFFESGSYKQMNFMIGVQASEEQRKERAMKRDNVSADAIQARMDKQMPDAQKMALCDAIILNDGTQSLIEQVLNIHQQILLNIKSK